MSPEICASERYGWHSDIWALGCIIHELCSGRPPFDAKSHLQLMQKIKAGRFDPISTMYSQELRDLIGKCLQVNPLNRPTTFQIINLPIVRIMRKERELVSVNKDLETRRAQAAHRLVESAAKNAELQTLVTQAGTDRQILMEKVRQETRATMRTEIDATLRREWEVKAQLEISKHCKLESDRLQRLFDSELQRHIDIGVATQVNAFKRWHQRQQQLSKGVDTPPSTDVSRLSLDLAAARVTTSSIKRSSRTPFLKAQTHLLAADSPMDIKMASPSPVCTALPLSPRRTALMAGGALPGLAPIGLFSNRAEAKEHWRPTLAYQSDSEEEEEGNNGIPEIPSPIVYRGQQRVLGVPSGGDPFKIPQLPAPNRPGFQRQQTLPVHIAPGQPDIFNNGKTLATHKSYASVAVSPPRQANKFLAKAATVVADNGGGGPATTGRTLVELNQARVANMTNIQHGRPSQGDVSHLTNKQPVAVWDPEVETEMPSPFVVRKGRGFTT